ncbi:MAG TPA: choice-of-anchor tandem repeat GloVer-containing protein [Rhizomicrobium sp.]|nr:choice-of-anchor tandem repeat GloVer-containing protein [Rhizomicrobium sp.]
MSLRVLLLSVAAAAAFVPLGCASASTLETLYTFCVRGEPCSDGEFPSGGLLRDGQGDLFGVTQYGGNAGMVYELVPNAKRTKWKERVLHAFNLTDDSLPRDGGHPTSPLIMDVAGNIYGTVMDGGKVYGGLVFELMPRGGKKWKLKILHEFCKNTQCSTPTSGFALTYAGASSGALYDGVSPLYGVEEMNGAHGRGLVFQIAPGTAKRWDFKTLYSFCPLGGDCDDGAFPHSGLLIDAAGALYGMAAGGHDNPGVIFKLTPNKKKTRWQEAVLHSFSFGFGDGNSPYGGLVMDRNGNLFGVTAAGGISTACPYDNGCGTIFELTPAGTTWQETVLHSFCQLENCTDGLEEQGEFLEYAQGQLVLDGSGNIFGTTLIGPWGEGGNGLGYGVFYELSGSSFNVLYTFCHDGGTCSDGSAPRSIFRDDAGNFFGTTGSGGNATGAGTVFELTP